MKIYETVDHYADLYKMLSKVSLYLLKQHTNQSRLGFPTHRGCVFGMVKPKFRRDVQLSYYSRKCPEIYAELCRIGKLICPFEFKTIQVNHNLVCPPHIDRANKSESILVSFGEYTGGLIVIEGKEYNAYHTPIQFDGSKQLHWNTPIQGNKYSLVFFS